MGLPMQPIIDIIKELIEGQLGYFNRGDPAAWDFTTADFTVDNAWHSLDLSSIIPANTRLVMFTSIIRSTVVNRFFALRLNGQANDLNSSLVRTQVAGLFFQGDMFCTADAARFIEYKSQLTLFFIQLIVRGWWL